MGLSIIRKDSLYGDTIYILTNYFKTRLAV